MLIGQQLRLSFAGYLLDSLVPTILSLLACWWIIERHYRAEWYLQLPWHEVKSPHFNLWQSSKGLLVITVLVMAFLFTEVPREVAALAGAGLLLMSRRMASRNMLGLVDWQLLVLFIGLFIVNHAIQESHWLDFIIQQLQQVSVDLHNPATLYVVTVILSNIVSNVPAVLLLLPSADHPFAGSILALSSTLAGNLILVGSIANLIVVDKASELGVEIDWKRHARIGIPVTVSTLLIAAGWLWLRMVWLT
jgi:Na+/H+ antiporter NhaD/arsenite permease-like protein